MSSRTTPPHDLEAEEAVLGAVLLSNVPLVQLIIDVGLTASAFYRELHGRIWGAMRDMAMNGDVVDPVTLRGRLEADGAQGEELKRVDWLPAACPSVGAVFSYARRVMELAEWRQVLAAAMELHVAVLEQDPEKRRMAEGMLTTTRRSRGDTRSPEQLGEDVWRHLEGHAVPSWRTPWPRLNEALGGGLRAGEVTLLGGWTSAGKSVVTDQLLRWCGDLGAKVHLYANEMPSTMRALRSVSAMTEIPQATLAQPKRLNDNDRQKAVGALGRLPFGITQVTDWSADEIARDIRFRGWDVCALDLVHRLPFREERDLAQISTTLNAAAQTSSAHLIAVVHLNEGRAVGATLPPPVLRDIRGSGMLKNDADNVLFVHRDEKEEGGGIAVRGLKGVLYLAKCRNGRLEKVDVEFDPRRSRFLEPVAPNSFAVLKGGIANGD